MCVKKKKGRWEEGRKRRREEGRRKSGRQKARVKAARATFFFRGVNGTALGPIGKALPAASMGLVSSRVLQPYDTNGGTGTRTRGNGSEIRYD